MGRSKRYARKSNRQNKEYKRVKDKLKFPNCTEIYEECKGREEPCVTCPYKEGWKQKVKKEEK